MKDLQRYFLLELPVKLKALKPDAERQFGEMDIIQMLDHLRKSYKWAYSGVKARTTIPKELIPKAQAFLASDKEFRPGAAMPAPFQAIDNMEGEFEEMKLELLREMVGMLAYFENNPKHQQIHPGFGKLNVLQWLQLAKKHTEHHLRQFGL
jgi:hypothetical protein